MKKALNVLLLACASVVFGSCNKFSNGDVTTQIRQTETFQIVEMCDNVDVTLKHCDAQNPAGSIIITTGENLIDNIGTEIEEIKIGVTHNGVNDTLVFNKLVITNDNNLNFLRPYNYTLETTVYYDSLFELIFNSNATIITDTLRGYNYWTNFNNQSDSAIITADSLRPNILLSVIGGSGDFNVLTNCFRLMTNYIHGTSNLILKGHVVRAETYSDYDCHGVIDGFDMEADSYHMVTALGTNKIIARAFNQIIAQNDNIGHVYYVRYSKPGKIIHWGHHEGGHWVNNDTIDTLYSCPLGVTKRGVYKDSITSVHDRPWP